MPKGSADLQDGLRRRLEPLLPMYPVAIKAIRDSGDRALEPLDRELVKTSLYVAGVVAQLNGRPPLE